MKNLQKGFISITLILIAIIVAAVIGGYFIFSKKSATPSISTPKTTETNNNVNQEQTPGYILWQGATIVPDKDRIQILSPKGGEKLEIGKKYNISWTNYSGTQPLTIALQVTPTDNKSFAKIIAFNVPTSQTGNYQWTVTSEDPGSKYKIEVYPAGGRPLMGESEDFFTISGEPFIFVTSPKPEERINITQPLTILGKARNVFSEGEFDVTASYFLDNQRKVITSTFATCNITGNNCDWSSGNFVDFKATLDLSSSPVCGINIDFYKRNEKTPEPQPFYTLPLWLYGNTNCQ